MASTADFRNGLTILFNGDIWTIVEFQHVKPGKGGAFVRTKLKNLKTGKVVDNTFRAGEKIDVARVERRTFQYLYQDANERTFMDQETFEQIAIADELLGDGVDFLKEGMDVDVLLHAELPIGVELPNFVELVVTETDPGLRGDTATGGTKPAKLETGAVVQVPLFINEGDKLRVDTRTYTYMERAK